MSGPALRSAFLAALLDISHKLRSLQSSGSLGRGHDHELLLSKSIVGFASPASTFYSHL